MKNQLFILIILLLMSPFVISAQKEKVYQVESPNDAITLKIDAGSKMQWRGYN
jgi:hypothetical protein